MLVENMFFFQLSGEVRRKIGLKVLELGANAVIGYRQLFDIEGESGIAVRVSFTLYYGCTGYYTGSYILEYFCIIQFLAAALLWPIQLCFCLILKVSILGCVQGHEYGRGYGRLQPAK